jgi:RHS repeat-associated protein
VGTSTTPTNAFTERNLTYDKNGNILTLERYGASATTAEDDLADATYNGNQLASIENNGTEYAYGYDSNGNMTLDGLNALQLEYNFLNLTSAVSDSSGDPLATYTWLADGTKVGVVDDDGHGLEYTGSLIYKRNGTELELESTSFGGGRILVSDTGTGYAYTPNYFLTDHLGSTRVIYNGSTTIPRSDFMPFGTRWTNGQAPASRYQFAGYESQELLGDKYMDAGARFYNGLTFNTPDPLSGDYPWITHYTYCGNNPVSRVDPNGLDWYSAFDERKKISYTYTTEYRSQKDLDKAGIAGTYIGLTGKTDDGAYLSLFGQEFTTGTKEEQQIARMVQNLDETVKNYYKENIIDHGFGIMEEMNYFHNMAVPGTTVGKTTVFQYGEGTVRYAAATNMSGGVFSWGSGKYSNLSYFSPKIPGYHANVNRSGVGASFQVLHWTFPNAQVYNATRQQANTLFNGRPGYRK